MKTSLAGAIAPFLLLAFVAGCSGPSVAPMSPVAQAGSTPASAGRHAQEAIPAAEPTVPTVRILPADIALASKAVPGKAHIFYNRRHADLQDAGARIAPEASVYPGDLVKGRGPVMKSAVAYDIYVTTPSLPKCTTQRCWGHPQEFLKGLTGSRLAGLLAQYTGGDAAAYTYGGSLHVEDQFMYTDIFYDNDLYDVLAAAYRKFKVAGLGTIYHVFLPPGADTCFSFTAVCYSPDYPPTDDFCAYHDYVGLAKDPIVYTVEPYQVNKLCETPVAAGTVALDNDTDSSLEHESFEAFTDPLPNTGWYNPYVPTEVADECDYFNAVQKFGRVTVNSQMIYSNAVHACTDNSP